MIKLTLEVKLTVSEIVRLGRALAVLAMLFV